MAATMTITGAAVDFMDMARPWMTLVPWPVVEALAMDFTGLKLLEVKYSVMPTIRPVRATPITASRKTFMGGIAKPAPHWAAALEATPAMNLWARGQKATMASTPETMRPLSL